MAWTFKNSVSWRGTANGTTSGSVNMSGADFFVCVMCSAIGPGGTIADSQSNSWFSVVSPGGGPSIDMYYAKNVTTDTAQTFTNSGSGNYAACFVYGFSGSNLSAPLTASNSAVGGAGVTSLQAGAVTPANGNDLFVTALSLGLVAADTITMTGYTVETLFYDGATSYQGSIGWKLELGGSPRNPTWNWTTPATSPVAAIATFAQATGGVTVRTRLPLLGVG